MARRWLIKLTWLALLFWFRPYSAQAVAQLPSPPPTTVQQRPDVQLQLQTGSGKTRFQIGEIIPLKLSFTSTTPKKYQINMATSDHSGRMHSETFLVEPTGDWSDPLRPYFAWGGFMEGGGASFRFLSPEPIVIPLVLNEWVRFNRPGRYSLHVVSHRVADPLREPSDAQRDSEPTSNQLDLTIVPAAQAWQEATLKQAVAILDLIKPPDLKPGSAPDEIKDTDTALKALRYLGTAAAARELARRLRGENSNTDFECMLGLVGSPAHDAAISEMHRLLDNLDHPVSSMFVHALRVLMRDPDQSQEKLAADESKNTEIIRGQLLDAVARKRGEALGITLIGVLETGSFEEGRAKPLGEQVAAQLAAVFDQLPLEKQGQILGYNWDWIKSPVFLPVLRKYAAQYREFSVPNEINAHNSLLLSGSALQRWYELEPAEARPVIIQEILRPRPRYSARVLGILPDETLPEAEHALAEHFAAEPDNYAAENLASLLHRYATEAVLPQVLPVVDEYVGRWACAIQAPILAYLLRVNPDIARPRIEAAIAARGKGYSACNHFLLSEISVLEQSPVLQEIAVRALDDDDPEVAANAAGYLGKYGPPDAEQTLWEHLVRWNEKWNGKEEQLRYVPGAPNDNSWPHRSQGESLILALATAKSWLADDGKLARLRQLAIGADIQHRVDGMLAGRDRKPWKISYFRSGDQLHFQVLQYELDSLKGLEDKLAQFAPGSDFNWVGAGGPASEEEKGIARELAEFLASHGMKLSHPAN